MFSFLPIADFHDRATWQRFWYEYDPQELPERGDFAWNRLHDKTSMVKGVMICADGQPVGFAHYILSETTLSPKLHCYLKDLFVASEHRSKGAGKAALQWFKDQARLQGWADVILKTRLENTGAQKLYERTCESRSGYVHYNVVVLGL